jgi:hypothetical protein
MQSLSAHVRSKVSDENLASTISKLFSPASDDGYYGLPDHKRIAVASLEDPTKFIFGNGIPFPGYEKFNLASGGIAPAIVPTMAPGSTWNLIVLMMPCFTSHGFWRMEYTDVNGTQQSRIGVLPTATAIIREKCDYVYARVPSGAVLGYVSPKVVSQGGNLASAVGQLAGRLRMPGISITTHLDAPDLANQGMVASANLGQSFDVNGNVALAYLDDLGGGTYEYRTAATAKEPLLEWTGPSLDGNSSNITSVVQILANDPSSFVEKPLKEDGSYDISRTADLNWHPGIGCAITNPLYTGPVFTLDSAGLPALIDARTHGIADTSVSPQIIAYSGVSSQANLNLRSHVLLDVEPEVGSTFVPFKRFPPSCSAKATKFLAEFASCASSVGHTFPASANDTHALASALKSALGSAVQNDPEGAAAVGPKRGKAGMVSAITGVANNVVSGMFNPVTAAARNTRQASVRTNKQNNKTQRHAAKQATKQAKIAAKRR